MKKVLILIITIIFLGCKNDSKKTNEISKEELIEVDNNKSDVLKNIDLSDGKYRIIFEGVFEEDDLILIYYITKAGEKLTTEKSLRQKIVGSPDTQKVVLTFEKNEKPYNLRIDFSDNKLQKNVKLNNIIFVDNYNKITINNYNIDNYFAFNNTSKNDKTNKLLIGEVYDINGKQAYNPYFIAKKNFIDILKSFNEASLNKKNEILIDDIYNMDLKDGRERMIITGTFKTNDLILLYYTEDTLQSFDIKRTVRKKVYASDVAQEIIFTFPNDVYAAKLKLDISDNKLQKGINIEKIKIFTDKTEIIINKTNLSTYFAANNYIDFNKETGEFNCKIIKANDLEKYNPYFISTAELIEELLYL